VNVTSPTDPPKNRDPGIGCLWTILGLNMLLMGLFALSSIWGPYSTTEQEFWYRWVPLGFLLAGAVLPGIGLAVARKPIGPGAISAAIIWLLIALVAFTGFAMMSGGGV
jgi:hypothetical protein